MSRYYNRVVVAKYRSKCSFCWQKTIKKRSHFGLLVHQGFTVYAFCDVFVNTCEGRVHALNPLCLSDFRR